MAGRATRVFSRLVLSLAPVSRLFTLLSDVAGEEIVPSAKTVQTRATDTDDTCFVSTAHGDSDLLFPIHALSDHITTPAISQTPDVTQVVAPSPSLLHVPMARGLTCQILGWKRWSLTPWCLKHTGLLFTSPEQSLGTESLTLFAVGPRFPVEGDQETKVLRRSPFVPSPGVARTAGHNVVIKLISACTLVQP